MTPQLCDRGQGTKTILSYMMVQLLPSDGFMQCFMSAVCKFWSAPLY